jgi:hypothetical protein
VQRKDELRWQQQADSIRQRMGVRYVPGGKAQRKDLHKSSLNDCLLQVHATLSHDWPISFVQVCCAHPETSMNFVHKKTVAVQLQFSRRSVPRRQHGASASPGASCTAGV